MAVKIAIYNQKGGVGKTASTKSIGGSLSKRGYNTLLIDIDSSENTTQGIAHSESPKVFYAQLLIENVEEEAECDVNQAICKTDFSKLDLMPSKRSLMKKAERTMEMASFSTNILFSDLFRSLDEEYDFIIMDCGAGSKNNLTTNALVFADYVLVPFEPSIDSISGYAAVKDTIKTIKRDNKNLAILGTFLNKYNTQTNISKMSYANAKETLGKEFIDIPIRQSVEVDNSRVVSSPLCYFNKSCKTAQDYESLTDELLRRIGESK